MSGGLLIKFLVIIVGLLPYQMAYPIIESPDQVNSPTPSNSNVYENNNYPTDLLVLGDYVSGSSSSMPVADDFKLNYINLDKYTSSIKPSYSSAHEALTNDNVAKPGELRTTTQSRSGAKFESFGGKFEISYANNYNTPFVGWSSPTY